MIDEAAIEAAVWQIVQGSGLFANMLAEGDTTIPPKPYIVLSVQALDTVDESMAQTDPVWVGIISAGIVTELDQFATEGRALARSFGNLFRSGMRIQIGGGVNVTVQSHPYARARYRDGGGYRQPVIVQLRSEYLTT